MRLFCLYAATVKVDVEFVMAANYSGFSSRREHQTVRLSAFVAGGRQADQPGERLMHTAALSSSPNARLCVIDGLQSQWLNSAAKASS